ncbi:unnamed protein product [Aphanomyces euteiches]|uniref:Peptidase C51 domain-containing protein n=1 Tax=Aphanomyces euteiches TaxID=100861 RepID=A0A6G0X4P4_9STRA|nr:hypothetical protein Ae201684_008425 [Aphanomyces euteiches]KAH9070536.1 hypothetical protein Ae201684P_002893 [Aphanomyces euteiches]KAH9156193.1 hypothetical protein AeRB84_001870 [Aphanomyces euteiches]
MARLDVSKLGVLLRLVLCVTVAVVTTNETTPAPWGTVIGVTSGVKVFSNDNPPPTDSYNFYPDDTDETNGTFTGLRWQCVELARRYLLVTQGVVFESVDDAVGIFSLREVINVTTDKRLPLDIYPQGSPVPPKVGSLVIWDRPGYYTPYDHVAVVINIQDTFIDVAEENLEKTSTGNHRLTIPAVFEFRVLRQLFMLSHATTSPTSLRSFLAGLPLLLARPVNERLCLLSIYLVDR